MSEWISVKDGLPEYTHDFGSFALVSDCVKAISISKGDVIADWSTQGWCDTDGDCLEDITHWQPLPPPL